MFSKFISNIRQGWIELKRRTLTILTGAIIRFGYPIIDIEGKLCGELLFANGRPGSVRFVCSNIRKAQLVPNYTPNVGRRGLEFEIRTILVKTLQSVIESTTRVWRFINLFIYKYQASLLEQMFSVHGPSIADKND